MTEEANELGQKLEEAAAESAGEKNEEVSVASEDSDAGALAAEGSVQTPEEKKEDLPQAGEASSEQAPAGDDAPAGDLASQLSSQIEAAQEEPASQVEDSPADSAEVAGDSKAESAPATEDSPEGAVVDGTEAEDEGPKNENLKWYVVNAYSGFEARAKKSLEERIRNSDLEFYFGDIYIPEETVVELVRGEKKTSTRKFFPGYMLVQMEVNQDTWHLVTETPKISGFIGDRTSPIPLSEEEVAQLFEQVEEGAASPKARVTFQEGETIKVIDGPFTDFNGTVDEVKPDKGKVRVRISIFGRATPVELDFVQVERV